MENLPLKASEVVGFKEIQIKVSVKRQLAECVLNTKSLEKFDTAEQILLEAHELHEEAWKLVFKHLGAEAQGIELKYDSYNELILKA